jgi:hypothetical protein
MKNLTSRITPLDALTRALRREILTIRQANAPLLYLERIAYLKALDSAASGLETARIVLVKARQRIDTTGM